MLPDIARSPGELQRTNQFPIHGVQTPVVFILFNRPEVTARVFGAIRRARPSRLFLIADGPRDGHPTDPESTRAARSVTDAVDWPCDVIRDFSETNLGVGRRIASGLDRVFESVEEAIILEDDCLPDASFFPFCESLLDRYREDERIMLVSGTNNITKWKADEQDFHFSAIGSIWGWATWRRAWQHYDFAAGSLDDPAVVDRVRRFLENTGRFETLRDRCTDIRCGVLDTWDYQWTWSRAARGGLAAVSAVNLVSNLGFGSDATHTTGHNFINANLARFEASFPLRPPPDMMPDREYDRRVHQALTHRPELEAVIDQGLLMLESGRHIHAIILFDEAYKLQPEAPELLYLKAKALLGLGRKNAAVEVLQDLIERFPVYEPAGILLESISESH